MSKQKNTPAPWRYSDHGDKRHREFAIMGPNSLDGEEGKVGSVFAGFGAHFSWETAEANARLIAAAPDLLNALQEIRRISGGTLHGEKSAAEALAVIGTLAWRAIDQAGGAK